MPLDARALYLEVPKTLSLRALLVVCLMPLPMSADAAQLLLAGVQSPASALRALDAVVQPTSAAAQAPSGGVALRPSFEEAQAGCQQDRLHAKSYMRIECVQLV